MRNKSLRVWFLRRSVSRLISFKIENINRLLRSLLTAYLVRGIGGVLICPACLLNWLLQHWWLLCACLLAQEGGSLQLDAKLRHGLLQVVEGKVGFLLFLLIGHRLHFRNYFQQLSFKNYTRQCVDPRVLRLQTNLLQELLNELLIELGLVLVKSGEEILSRHNIGIKSCELRHVQVFFNTRDYWLNSKHTYTFGNIRDADPHSGTVAIAITCVVGDGGPFGQVGP